MVPVKNDGSVEVHVKREPLYAFFDLELEPQK
jgi:hypothetical protein